MNKNDYVLIKDLDTTLVNPVIGAINVKNKSEDYIYKALYNALKLHFEAEILNFSSKDLEHVASLSRVKSFILHGEYETPQGDEYSFSIKIISLPMLEGA